jgi:type I restriction enzyme R subunit
MRLRPPLIRFPTTRGGFSVTESAGLAQERARQHVDLLPQQSGWIVQDRSQIDLAADPGVAIPEKPLLMTGEADYLLFAGGKAIATVETKPEGYTLNGDLD